MDQFARPYPPRLLPPPAPEDDTSAADRLLSAGVASLTGGFSPTEIGFAFLDWATTLASHPHRRLELAQSARDSVEAFWRDLLGIERSSLMPSATDHRFGDPRWQDLLF